MCYVWLIYFENIGYCLIADDLFLFWTLDHMYLQA